jgi:hypothetical protein
VVDESLGSATSQTHNHVSHDIYELYAILVHSGSAGFGHYYAFVKNFTDGRWLAVGIDILICFRYKLNDEQVTLVDEDDIKMHNWIGGERSTMGAYSWFHNTSMQRVCATYYFVTNCLKSATPYMLVYRRQVPVAKKDQEMGDDTFKMSPVENSEIPQPVAKYLMIEQQRKEQKRAEKEKEMNSCSVTVHRNRLELMVTSILGVTLTLFSPKPLNVIKI